MGKTLCFETCEKLKAQVEETLRHSVNGLNMSVFSKKKHLFEKFRLCFFLQMTGSRDAWPHTPLGVQGEGVLWEEVNCEGEGSRQPALS